MRYKSKNYKRIAVLFCIALLVVFFLTIEKKNVLSPLNKVDLESLEGSVSRIKHTSKCSLQFNYLYNRFKKVNAKVTLENQFYTNDFFYKKTLMGLHTNEKHKKEVSKNKIKTSGKVYVRIGRAK